MIKILSFSSLVLVLCACASAPDPVSWKKDLENIQAVPINKDIDTTNLYYELNKKDVWK